MNLIPIILAAWMISAALLAIEHVYFRTQPRLVRYILGTVTICLGTTFAGVLTDNATLAIVPWVVASSGVVVIGLYWNEDKAARDQANAQKRGEVVGMARGLHQALSQEMIDRGDDPTRN